MDIIQLRSQDQKWTPPTHLAPCTAPYSKLVQPHPSYYEPSHHSPVSQSTAIPEKSEWMIPLCYEPKDDVETCCLGCWCPAILYGQTQYRLRQLEKNKDPLDMSEFKVIEEPCLIFYVLRLTTNCDWLFIYTQHSRIRAKYNIAGNKTTDCCSAYFCAQCTLMQADREIRARVNKSTNVEKISGTVNHQPKTEPNMHYSAPSMFEDSLVQAREGLVKEKTTIAVTGQSQILGNNGQKLEKQQKLEQPKHQTELKKPHSETKVNGGHGKVDINKRMMTSQDSQASIKEAVNNVQSVELSQGGRDVMSSPRDASRYQSILGKKDRLSEHSLSACIGDGTKSSENQAPIFMNRHTVLEHSEDVSISQVRGKRILKQLARSECSNAHAPVSNKSESIADQPVLVFYDDGEHPQRHLLTDYARFRSSTIGRTDTPHENEQQGGWRVEKTVGQSGQAETTKSHSMNAYPEVIAMVGTNRVSSEHAMSDCAIQDIKEASKDKHHDDLAQNFENCPADSTGTDLDSPVRQNQEHSLEDCNSSVHATAPELTESKTSDPELIQQHRLESCAIGSIASVKSMSVDGFFQHHLVECAGGYTESASESTAESAFTVANPAPEQLSPNQHRLIDCAKASEYALSDVPGDHDFSLNMPSCLSQNHSNSNLRNEQNGKRTITITMPQPPLIIITTSKALDEAMRDQHDSARCRSLDFIVESQEAQALTEPSSGASSLIRHHDGATDTQGGRQQLTGAEAALRKVLHAAADEGHLKSPTELERSDITRVDTNDKAKKSSTRSRSKTVGGRVQKGKGKA